MEKYYTIPTSDGFEIDGVLNSQQKSDILLIFVHGFTGNMNEAHYYCAKEYFLKEGFDVFRFNLYTSGEQTRKLRDCTVYTHSRDIEDISQYFLEYKRVVFVGHSLAGPCLGGVHNFGENVDTIILWDPAFNMKNTAKRCYLENGRVYFQSSGKHLEVCGKMYQEFQDTSFFDVLEKQKFPKSDIFTIYADGDYHIEDIPITNEMGITSYVIHGANHGFTQEGKYQELFEKTLEFIKR